ncbi:hypothetical protein LEMLEM_LOCUS3775 [Lemmus lemmus]
MLQYHACLYCHAPVPRLSLLPCSSTTPASTAMFQYHACLYCHAPRHDGHGLFYTLELGIPKDSFFLSATLQRLH